MSASLPSHCVVLEGKAVGYCFKSLLSVSLQFKLCHNESKAFIEFLRRHAQGGFLSAQTSRKNRLL